MKQLLKTLYIYFFLIISIIKYPRIQAQLRRTASGDRCRLAITNSNLIVFKSTDENYVYSARGYSPHNMSVAYKCRPKFALQGPDMNTCIDGVWETEHPTCIRYCPSEDITGVTIQTLCEYNDERISCDQILLPGTKAKINCQIGYTLPRKRIKEVLFCGLDGRWDSLPFSCEPVCGTEPIQTRPFIFDGTKINSTIVPWHAAIYSLDPSDALKYRCGGTIISERVVLTAAHCFSEDFYSEKLLDKSLLTVAIGKSYREITADEPITPHFFKLTELFIPIGFNGSRSNIQTNIALAVLDGIIKFNMFVKPICIEWQSLENQLVSSNLIGRIAGFGYYNQMVYSNELRVADLPTLSNDDCLKIVDKYNFNTLTYDTFCINTNGRQHVCAGDSGSGFVIPKIFNGFRRYYLWGVLTGAFGDVQCSTPNITAVAVNIQFYSTDINQIISEYIVK